MWHKPDITSEALHFFRDNHDPEKHMFEWGSGHSTPFFASKFAKLISVEYNREWFQQTSLFLSEFDNVELLLVPPDRLTTDCEKFASLCPDFKNDSFRKYASVIDGYEKFQWISVDGRGRIGCMIYAQNHMEPNGFLMLDDAHRYGYASVIDSYDNDPHMKVVVEGNTRIWQFID